MTPKNGLLGWFSSQNNLLILSQVLAHAVLGQVSYKEYSTGLLTSKARGMSLQGKRDKAVTSFI